MSDAVPPDFSPARFRRELRLLAEMLLAPRLNGKVDPSDLVQSALIQALRQGEAFTRLDPPAQFAWLRQAVVHLIANAARELHRRKRDIDREIPLPKQFESSARWEQMLASVQTSPSREAERNEFVRQLAALDAGGSADDSGHEVALIRALAQLTRTERLAIVHKYIQDRKQQEIADALGLSTG